MKPTAELTERLRSGSRDALFTLMTAHYNDLFRYAIRFTADKDLTKDIVGQFFLHIWQHRDKFCNAENTERYLMVAFKRYLINYLQKISRQLNIPPPADLPVEYAYEEYLIAWQDDEIIRTSLRRAIDSLPPRQKELVRMRFYEKMSYREISLKTSLTPRTVYNKLHEAIKRLRNHSVVEEMRRKLIR